MCRVYLHIFFSQQKLETILSFKLVLKQCCFILRLCRHYSILSRLRNPDFLFKDVECTKISERPLLFILENATDRGKNLLVCENGYKYLNRDRKVSTYHHHRSIHRCKLKLIPHFNILLGY